MGWSRPFPANRLLECKGKKGKIMQQEAWKVGIRRSTRNRQRASEASILLWIQHAHCPFPLPSIPLHSFVGMALTNGVRKRSNEKGGRGRGDGSAQTASRHSKCVPGDQLITILVGIGHYWVTTDHYSAQSSSLLLHIHVEVWGCGVAHLHLPAKDGEGVGNIVGVDPMGTSLPA